MYAHESPSSKLYIGITSQNVEKRWQNGRGYINNEHFYRAILKYGWENFKHIIISDNLSEQEAKEMEIELIAKFKTNNYEYGYNISAGGDGCSGCHYHHSEEARMKISEANKRRKLSEETKQKISKSHKGKILSEDTKRKISKSNKCRIISDETRKKLSESSKGKILSDETRKKLSEINKGKKLSEETKQKMSKSRKGRIFSSDTIQKIREANNIHILQFDLDMNLIKEWNGATEASRETGINQSNITATCRYKRNKAGGYIWRYSDDYKNLSNKVI